MVKGIVLSVNDRVEVNGRLKVGGLEEVVEVMSERTVVQTTPAVQNLVASKQVEELPLNNRNFVQLATLAPGVSSDLPDEVGIGLTSTVSISINGGRRNAVNWLVDGVSNVDVGSNITLLSTPTLESIQEFKIITSSYAAEWPRSGGGIVNVVTKAGTNRYSGSAYYFGRSDKLNANSFIRNMSSDPSVAGHPPKLDYKNFGYTFGGPVPMMQDNLFFFWSQEWRRITRAPASLTANVPDPTWLTDPASSNYVAPALRDPNAVKLLAAWPAPNVAGKNQYLVSSPNINNTRQEVIRLDYDLSPRWRFTTRYTHDLSAHRRARRTLAFPRGAQRRHDEHGRPGHSLRAPGQDDRFEQRAQRAVAAALGQCHHTSNPVGTMGRRSDYGITIPELFPENNRTASRRSRSAASPRIGSSQLYHIEYINHSVDGQLLVAEGQSRAEGRRAHDLRAEERECGQRHAGLAFPSPRPAASRRSRTS